MTFKTNDIHANLKRKRLVSFLTHQLPELPESLPFANTCHGSLIARASVIDL